MSDNDSIYPLGRDCACGHPMVTRHGVELCAVYGRHLTAPPVLAAPGTTMVTFRNHMAPGAALVDLCASTPSFRSPAELEYARRYQQHARAQQRRRRERAVA